MNDEFEGVVKEWNDDEGIGVIASAMTPGDCFFSGAMDGYRTVAVGQRVTFTCERARQDGCEWFALSVRPHGELTRHIDEDVSGHAAIRATRT